MLYIYTYYSGRELCLKKVSESKDKINRGIALYSVILTFIPVLIIMFTGFMNFTNPYGIYSLFTFGICFYFSVFIAILTRKNVVLYAIFDIINAICGIGFIIVSYIFSSYQGGLLLHLASSFMLIYSIYRESDAKQDDSYNSCYLPPLAYIVGGLIFVLWFITVKFYIPVHIVIVTIVNLFTLIYFIPSVVTTFKKGSDFYYDIVDNDKVVYQDQTDEEKEEELRIKQNKKEEKIRAKQEENSKNNSSGGGRKKNDKISKFEEKNLYDEFKHLPYGYTLEWVVDPDVIDTMLEKIRREFNNIVEYINMSIRTNNAELDYQYRTVESGTEAKKNLKNLDKEYKLNKRAYKSMVAKLKKLKKLYFQINMYINILNTILKAKELKLHHKKRLAQHYSFAVIK